MCWVCAHKGESQKGFAIWFYNSTEFSEVLCKKCLDIWLDNADDDDSLEPSNVIFIH